jgi:RNA polymerase sigma factor (sigma-70 family)
MKPKHEIDLIRRVAVQDRLAFEELYLLYHRRLFRFILRYTQRLDFVEEIVNDVMLVVWQQADRFGERSRLSTWIFGIAYRTALKRLRSAGRIPDGPDIDELEIVDHSKPEPDAELSRKQLQELLADALAQISPEQRAVVELTYYHGYSYPEIAQIVGCPPNTVKTRMYHARLRLKKLLPQTSGGLIDQQGVGSWL